MIDLAKWLSEAHEDVEEVSYGVYRHVFTFPDTLKLYLPGSLIDRINLTLTPGSPPVYDIVYRSGVTIEIVRPLRIPRKLRKCHMRKIFKRRQMERRRYGKSE